MFGSNISADPIRLVCKFKFFCRIFCFMSSIECEDVFTGSDVSRRDCELSPKALVLAKPQGDLTSSFRELYEFLGRTDGFGETFCWSISQTFRLNCQNLPCYDC